MATSHYGKGSSRRPVAGRGVSFIYQARTMLPDGPDRAATLDLVPRAFMADRIRAVNPIANILSRASAHGVGIATWAAARHTGLHELRHVALPCAACRPFLLIRRHGVGRSSGGGPRARCYLTHAIR